MYREKFDHPVNIAHIEMSTDPALKEPNPLSLEPNPYRILKDFDDWGLKNNNCVAR